MRTLFILFILIAIGYGKICIGQNEEIRKDDFRESTCNGTDRQRLAGSLLCKEGFHRDEDGRCVEWENCSAAKKCQTHETYHICGKPCDKTCSFPKPDCDLRCGTAACICADGYYRNLNGICIPLEQCQQCPENEEYKQYPSYCEHTCTSTWSSLKFCNETKTYSDPTCLCKKGYVRDAKAGNKCILPQYCSDPICRENQVYGFVECENSCGKSTRCDYDWGCHCKSGFLRDSYSDCVPKGKCKVTHMAEPFNLQSIYDVRWYK